MQEPIEVSYKCISKLKETGDYFHRWKIVRDVYAPKLDKGPLIQEEGVTMTPHDYSGHCVNIYNILSWLIPDSSYRSINTEHLFILDVAVILHDIMMTYNPLKRPEHSQAGMKYVIDTVKEFNSALSMVLTPDEADSIGFVIFGHSDIKNQNGQKTMDMLPTKEQFVPGKMHEPINVRVLSGLLRLADELDINSNRVLIEHKGYMKEEKSEPHWRKCDILHMPKIDPNDPHVILLLPRESTITSEGNFETDVDLLIEVRDKIMNELDDFNKKIVYYFPDFLLGWNFNTIKIQATGELLEKIQSKDRPLNPLIEHNNMNKTASEEERGGSEVVDGVSDSFTNSDEVRLLDDEFQKTITQWVITDRLIQSGHWEIDGNNCARDWIDVPKLLTNPLYFDSITSKFINRIQGNNCYLLGIDINGLRMASYIGFMTGNPFSYIIPERYKAYHSKHETNLEIPKDMSIILITDVIVTGNTLNNTIEDLKKVYSVKDEDITEIFSIFYREKIFCSTSCLDSNLKKKLVVLNKEIDVEICNKGDNCIFKKHGINLYMNKPIS
ncbi:phosphoribosyltransferase [Desulfosporosinus sp. FKB]|uniref:phosphoribosyltransferase n=1 Tax=Desulfosporosinus sp. FKB TaxID=1969835 RepID=UPI000B49AF8E|nr:phosphoribosyltransferase [Desulfosporosinus sp. FKB]